MSLTLVQVYTELRERLGDDASVDWTNAQLKNAIADAMRVAWPYFYEVVVDTTTYAGVNFRDVDTVDLAVPAAFYSTTGPGKITRIEWRRYISSGTNYYQWQPLPARLLGGRPDAGQPANPLHHHPQPPVRAKALRPKAPDHSHRLTRRGSR
jgi:hypothetical protein